jgi:hypothetical protein
LCSTTHDGGIAFTTQEFTMTVDKSHSHDNVASPLLNKHHIISLPGTCPQSWLLPAGFLEVTQMNRIVDLTRGLASQGSEGMDSADFECVVRLLEPFLKLSAEELVLCRRLCNYGEFKGSLTTGESRRLLDLLNDPSTELTAVQRFAIFIVLQRLFALWVFGQLEASRSTNSGP